MDIYIATGYALFPLPLFIIISTFASNFVTASEVSILSLLTNIAFFWCGFLLFFGMMTVHDYTLGKIGLTTLGSIVGMAFIMFLGLLFTSLVMDIVTFITNYVSEVIYRL